MRPGELPQPAQRRRGGRPTLGLGARHRVAEREQRRGAGQRAASDQARGVDVLARVRRGAGEPLGREVGRSAGRPAAGRPPGRRPRSRPAAGAGAGPSRSRRLAGLTSPCTRPRAWTAARASSSWPRSSATTASGSRPWRASRSRSEPPRTSSIAISATSSSAAQPSGASTCGCAIRCACSRTNPSSSPGSPPRRTFAATYCLPRRSRCPVHDPAAAPAELLEQEVASGDGPGARAGGAEHHGDDARHDRDVSPGSSTGAAIRSRPARAVNLSRPSRPDVGRTRRTSPPATERPWPLSPQEVELLCVPMK